MIMELEMVTAAMVPWDMVSFRYGNAMLLSSQSIPLWKGLKVSVRMADGSAAKDIEGKQELHQKKVDIKLSLVVTVTNAEGVFVVVVVSMLANYPTEQTNVDKQRHRIWSIFKCIY